MGFGEETTRAFRRGLVERDERLEKKDERLDNALRFMSEQDRYIFNCKKGIVPTPILVECVENQHLLNVYGAEELIARMEWMRSFELKCVPSQETPFIKRDYIYETVNYLTEEELIQYVNLYGLPNIKIGSTDSNEVIYVPSMDKLEYTRISTPEEFVRALTEKEKTQLKCYLQLGYIDELKVALNCYEY